jgi:ribonuclease-3
VIEQSGPDHDKRFMAKVRVGEEFFGNGEGKSKKEAEQHAAASAYTEINNLRP